MDKEMQQKLQELINDQDEILTISNCASTLNLPVQDASKVLQTFISSHNTSKPLGATYILSGTIEGKHKICLVKSGDLDEKRKEFDKIESEVIFSVQKSDVDLFILPQADKLNDKPLLGSVVGKNCFKRNVKVKKVPTPKKGVVKGKSSFFLPKEKVEPSNNNDEKKEAKPTKKNTNSISNMFSKVPKKETKVEDKIKEEKEEVKVIKESCQESDDSLKENMDVDFNDSFEEKPKVSAQPKISPEKAKLKEAEKKSTKRTRKENGKEPNSKRRKRIVQVNDSDSDDIFEKSDEDEDVIGVSDEEPPKPEIPQKTPKIKKRKAVENTFQDEDGYLVIKREFVMESDPEEEVKVEPPKPKVEKKTSSNSEPDISPQKKGKGKKTKKEPAKNQPTLMNFFKRK